MAGKQRGIVVGVKRQLFGDAVHAERRKRAA
jgi:hypothetical protein